MWVFGGFICEFLFFNEGGNYWGQVRFQCFRGCCRQLFAGQVTVTRWV
jgi:hypothetical protein